MIRTSSLKLRESAMCTDLCVTYRDSSGTPRRRSTPWWISSLIAIRIFVIKAIRSFLFLSFHFDEGFEAVAKPNRQTKMCLEPCLSFQNAKFKRLSTKLKCDKTRSRISPRYSPRFQDLKLLFL